MLGVGVFASAGSIGQPRAVNASALNELSNVRWQLDQGGIDVLWVGDSLSIIHEPYNFTDPRNYDCMIAVARRRLQDLLNNGVGGLGFVSFTHGTPTLQKNGHPILTNEFPNLSAGDAYSFVGKGPAGKDFGFASGTTRYFGAQLHGGSTNAAFWRRVTTQVSLVHRAYLGGPPAQLDVQQSSWPMRGMGTVSRLIPTDSLTTVYGRRSELITLPNPSGDMRVTVRGALAGNIAYVDGLLCFNGDLDRGIRVHDLANSGANTFTQWVPANLEGTVDSFLGGTGPATNAKVVVFSGILNEAGSYPSRSVSQLVGHIRSTVEYFLSRGLKVIFLIPPKVNPNGFWSPIVMDQAFLPIRDAVAGFAKQYPDDFVAVWAGAMNNDRPFSQTEVQSGFFSPDGKHYGGKSHLIMGRFVADLIARGFDGRN